MEIKKKIIIGIILLSISTTMVSAGKLEIAKKIGQWLMGAIGIGVLTTDLVSASGYDDDYINPASSDIKRAIEDGKIYYQFTFCTAKDGTKVAVSNDVLSCSDGNSPEDGLIIDLSQIKK